MQRAMIVALVLAGSLAHAERSVAPELGVVLDGRSVAATYREAGNKDGVHPTLGLQLVLGFEDAPMAVPPPGAIATDLRLVPELLAGFVADDVHAEGYVGAGLRGELQLASHRRGFAMRTAVYASARAIAIGEHRDGAAGFVIGEYLLHAGRSRFGWEGGALMRPHADGANARQLDAIMSVYIGW